MSGRFSVRLVGRQAKKENTPSSTPDNQHNNSYQEHGVAILRQRLIQLKVWPDAGDQFLALMPYSRWNSPPLTEVDHQWLPKVVEDVRQGVDIGANYPSFFQKLLTNDSLRQSFLMALDVQLGPM